MPSEIGVSAPFIVDILTLDHLVAYTILKKLLSVVIKVKHFYLVQFFKINLRGSYSEMVMIPNN